MIYPEVQTAGLKIHTSNGKSYTASTHVESSVSKLTNSDSLPKEQLIYNPAERQLAHRFRELTHKYRHTGQRSRLLTKIVSASPKSYPRVPYK